MSAAATDCFRFVQLELPGRFGGLDDGRYLVRPGAGEGSEGETVVVVQTVGAPPAGRRPRRRQRTRRAEPDSVPKPVPVTVLTVIPARPRPDEEAQRELVSLTRDQEAAEEAIAEALREANRVVRAHVVATQDAYGHEIGRDGPLVVRVGYGTGSELASGEWSEAFEIEAPRRRQRRADALRPQERLAELLAGREPIDVCETLLLRARADVDQHRMREAALQLGPALDALLAEVPERSGPGQEEDLAELRNRREAIGHAAQDALRGDLSAERASEIAETLRICERVLRRRQALRE
jgi:hypothetical protein